eukprot:365547-Prymnesium_polylepis.1
MWQPKGSAYQRTLRCSVRGCVPVRTDSILIAQEWHRELRVCACVGYGPTGRGVCATNGTNLVR